MKLTEISVEVLTRTQTELHLLSKYSIKATKIQENELEKNLA